jgi:hypothetical protein
MYKEKEEEKDPTSGTKSCTAYLGRKHFCLIHILALMRMLGRFACLLGIPTTPMRAPSLVLEPPFEG